MLKVIIPLIFFAGSFAGAQETSGPLFELKKKCSGYLADAWAKCPIREKTEQGYKLAGCSDLEAREYRIISMFDGQLNSLKLGKVCYTGVRKADSFEHVSGVLETINGAKEIQGPTFITDEKTQPISTVIGKDGTTAYRFFGGQWKAKRADGSLAYIEESDVQAILDGKTFQVPPRPLPLPPAAPPTFFEAPASR